MPANTSPFNILAIDDDDFIRIYLRDVFWLHGEPSMYSFTAVESIEKAREYLSREEEKPGLIFLDLQIPEQTGGKTRMENGLRFLEELKQDPNTRDIPVAVFSGYDERSIKARVKELGASKFITKGHLLPKEIIDIVREISCSTKKK